MKSQNWGRIINIASVHGLVASESKSAYVAAKHGLVGFAKVTALEGAPYGITANSMRPGDSYLLEDHLFLKKGNVLFFSPTEHNMYIDRSVFLINALGPDYILPQHHSTITVDETNRFWAKGYPDEVKIRLAQPLRDRYHILKPGDTWTIK